MSSTSIEQVRRLVAANGTKWSDILTLNLGIKKVQLGGEMLREIIADNKFESFWAKLKAQLPPDACLIDVGTPFSPILPMLSRNGEYRNGYEIIFGSSEWEIVPEGEIIPAVDILFIHTLTAEKS